MITRNDKLVFFAIVVLGIGAFFFLKKRSNATNKNTLAAYEAVDEGKKKKKGKKEEHIAGDPAVSVLQKWNVPEELKEISGIAPIDAIRFACIEDEQGKIYIYNTVAGKIEKTIPFAGVGDYEGIALVGQTAYVARSDGKLFEVTNYNSAKPTVSEHVTHLTNKHNVEGLCFDSKNNRLLLAIKDKEPSGVDYKGVYAFDLNTKQLLREPAFRVSNALKSGSGKDKIQPSDLELHPGSGDLYVIDGPGSRLIVLGSDGQSKQSYQLGTDTFPQPEGLAITTAGEMYISSEGAGSDGVIAKVSIAN